MCVETYMCAKATKKTAYNFLFDYDLAEYT